MSGDYTPQAWRFGDGPNQFYADQYATTSTRLDYDLDYDESRFNQHKAEFLADLAAHDAAVAAQAWRQGFTTGQSRAMRHMSDEPMLPLSAPNPYEQP